MIGSCLVGFTAASAQTPTPKPTTPPPATAPATQQPTKTKIAIISFLALRELIGELKIKYTKLQTEFNPRAIELESLQSTIASQEKVLAENKSLTPQQARKLADDVDLKKREYQRKLEDSQEMARRREGEETTPTLEKISDFLEKYCAQKGITHVFDIGRLQETGSALYVAPSANITEDFVKEYNKAFPAAAAPAATAPPPQTKKP